MNTEPKNTASQEVREPLSRKRRFFLFLGTYIIGALIVTIISIAIDAADSRYKLKDFFLAFLFLFPSVIIFLPWGVLPALEWISNHVFAIPLTLLDVHAGPFPEPANIFATLLMVLSYILFFALLRAGTKTDKLRIFRNLYFVFVFWVILNAGGCLVHPPG
jgi:hypothetical protein